MLLAAEVCVWRWNVVTVDTEGMRIATYCFVADFAIHKRNVATFSYPAFYEISVIFAEEKQERKQRYAKWFAKKQSIAGEREREKKCFSDVEQKRFINREIER